MYFVYHYSIKNRGDFWILATFREAHSDLTLHWVTICRIIGINHLHLHGILILFAVLERNKIQNFWMFYVFRKYDFTFSKKYFGEIGQHEYTTVQTNLHSAMTFLLHFHLLTEHFSGKHYSTLLYLSVFLHFPPSVSVKRNMFVLKYSSASINSINHQLAANNHLTSQEVNTWHRFRLHTHTYFRRKQQSYGR